MEQLYDEALSVTMISNAMSHHQLPFCEFMSREKGIRFHYIATRPLSKERLDMGYNDLNYLGDYIVRFYESEESQRLARELINDSDFVIWGSAPYSLIRSRIIEKKWVLVYSERIFKFGLNDKNLLKNVLYYWGCFALVSHKRLGVLCASAYAAQDFSKFRFKNNRMYKWGYFPPDTTENIDELMSKKKENSIVWVGRMLSWKHPELAVMLAEKLKKSRVPFHLIMVGDGDLFQEISEMVKEKELSEDITLTGSLPKEEVRKIMESSEILIATSDYAEGWGAIINEGMNSACAVVASHAMGATPFLIQNNLNGLTFESENAEELYDRISDLLENDVKRENIQKNALESIRNEWNGENAGRKLVYLCEQLKKGNDNFSYPDGICSIAEIHI